MMARRGAVVVMWATMCVNCMLSVLVIVRPANSLQLFSVFVCLCVGGCVPLWGVLMLCAEQQQPSSALCVTRNPTASAREHSKPIYVTTNDAHTRLCCAAQCCILNAVCIYVHMFK